jgi:hypothetical protein
MTWRADGIIVQRGRALRGGGARVQEAFEGACRLAAAALVLGALSLAGLTPAASDALRRLPSPAPDTLRLFVVRHGEAFSNLPLHATMERVHNASITVVDVGPDGRARPVTRDLVPWR